MATARARVSRALALVVPVLMSAVLVLVFGALIPVLGASAAFVALALVAWAARTPVGERVVARLLYGAREATMFQRYTLAPVAHLLLAYGEEGPHRLLLLVIKDRDVTAFACGHRTLLVSTGLLEALARSRIPATEAAAVITHELGVMRAGLARNEAPLTVVLVPWRLWLTVMGSLWHAARSVIPGALFRLGPLLTFGGTLWLSYDQDRRYLMASAALVIAFGAFQADAWWLRERSRVGDRYVYQRGLGRPLADLLMRSHSDRQTRERVVRLRTGQFETKETDTSWTDTSPHHPTVRP